MLTATEKVNRWRKNNPEKARELYRRVSKNYRLKYPEKAKERDAKIKATTYERRKKKMAYIQSLKDKPCFDCGGTFPAVCMDFHHKDPNEKVMSVSHMAALLLSQERIDAEVNKCILICANCHRLRTHLKDN